jgi:PEP-CTERM motif
MRSGRIVHPLIPTLVFSILLVVVLVSRATALLITFSDPASFDSVAGDVFPLPLSNLSQGPGEHLVCLPPNPLRGTPCRASVDGVTFTATKAFPEFNQRPELRVFDISGDTHISMAGTPLRPRDFFFTFSGHAIGFEIEPFAFPGSPVSLRITEADGHRTSLTVFTLTGGSFFGATSDIGFERLSVWSPVFHGSTNSFLLSDFVVDELSEPTPEPTTLFLFGTVATGLGIAAWRRRCHA